MFCSHALGSRHPAYDAKGMYLPCFRMLHILGVADCINHGKGGRVALWHKARHWWLPHSLGSFALVQGHAHSLEQPGQSRAGTLWIVPDECFGCLTVAGTVSCLYVQRCQTANMPMHANIRKGSIWASCTTLAQGLAECHEASSPLGKCIPRSLGQPRQHSTFGSIPGSACSGCMLECPRMLLCLTACAWGI